MYETSTTGWHGECTTLTHVSVCTTLEPCKCLFKGSANAMGREIPNDPVSIMTSLSIPIHHRVWLQKKKYYMVMKTLLLRSEQTTWNPSLCGLSLMLFWDTGNESMSVTCKMPVVPHVQIISLVNAYGIHTYWPLCCEGHQIRGTGAQDSCMGPGCWIAEGSFMYISATSCILCGDPLGSSLIYSTCTCT